MNIKISDWSQSSGHRCSAYHFRMRRLIKLFISSEKESLNDMLVSKTVRDYEKAIC